MIKMGDKTMTSSAEEEYSIYSMGLLMQKKKVIR